MFRAFIIAVSLVLAGCRGDYAIEVPNGYSLERLNSRNFVVTKTADDGISTPVTPSGIYSFQIIGKFIVGEISVAASDEVRWGKGTHYIFDTDSGSAAIAASLSDLEAQMRRRGVLDAPSFRFRPLR